MSTREAEQNLAQMRAVFDALPAAVIVADPEGNILSFNPAALRLYGYSSMADVRTPLNAFPRLIEVFDLDGRPLPPEEWPISRVLRGESFSNAIMRVVRTDTGKTFIGAYGGSLVRDPAGRPFAAVLTTRDVTAEHEAREALRKSAECLEAANRAKDDFLATLSHDLRTPLTPVLMISQMLASEPSLPESVREDLRMIRTNVELEARLIDDLLDLTRIAHGKVQLRPVRVNAHRILKQALKTSCDGSLREKSLDIQCELGAEDDRLHADPMRLEQVFWNLINNAIKFTPHRGRIWLRTSNPEPGRLRIEVSDTGMGIDPDRLNTIFNAFEQGDSRIARSYGGLGLGLAICRALLEMHGGSIQAASEGPGRGSTFTIDLPLTPWPDEPSPSAAPEPRAGKRPLRPYRILLVEDHRPTSVVLSRLLRNWGYECDRATDVQTALQAVQDERPDFVLSDLGLPDGSGHDLMRRLHDEYGLRGIAFSGYGMEKDVQQSLSSGFVSHLTKPFDLDLLKTTLDTALKENEDPDPPRS